MIKKGLLACLLLFLSLNLSAVSVSGSSAVYPDSFNLNAIEGIVTPYAYTETVINTSQQQQRKIGAFAWENVGAPTYTYRNITFQNSYTLTSITGPTYTPTTGSGTLYRYEVYTYNYSYN